MTDTLAGLRILNTRPQGQAEALSLAIRQAGGIAINCPALAIEATDSTWLSALPGLVSIDYVLFTSANAVNHFFMQVSATNWPAGINVIAIGQGTASALKKHHINTYFIPVTADSEHILALPVMQAINNKTVLLCKGQGGRTLIAEILMARGAVLHTIDVYKRVLPLFNKTYLDSIWRDQIVDIILFTSQQAMHNIFIMFGEKAYTWLRSRPCVVISERLAAEAKLLGIQSIMISRPEELLTTLHKFKQGLFHAYQ